ncbi:site-2 protease family protein [Alicyclobacillus cycloheptanicus]|uniref:Stage IV sporulation protein FB n=1 Tax=Alicyclobacillus cycloheptanicus TaxID=1457 RepID=A0ABT9XDE9_9BACL|nr:site-2 protease family protein [Alicyclobacillus cycloheptanicus]MDQ0188324.1 stage IV sporulation protein FB [Alicyclobacillus cycloheptanicus]WDM01038.1 site-2 protease family protein [Alicyclobacillus cycloheptanicus]
MYSVRTWWTERRRQSRLPIRFHPLFFVLALCAVGFGLWQEIVVLFLLVLLHELGHAAVANHLGYEVEEVSLLPFGGVAKLSYGRMGPAPRHEALIAIAGPLVNLLLVAAAMGMSAAGLWGTPFTHTVIRLNLWIAIFNMLPAMPLDGGRILRAARSRTIGYEQATREAYRMAIVISLALLCLGGVALWAGFPHVGLLILGVFLFISAWTGRRDISMDTVRFLDAKRQAAGARPEVIRSIAAPADTTVRDVVKQFSPDRYHLVYVLDEQGGVRSILEEEELLDAVFEGRWLETLEAWLD